MALLSNNLQQSYGWDVELTCGQCGSSGLPRYEGRSPSLSSSVPGAVVFAKVACTRCGRRLTAEAGKKLVELFADRDISGQNKKIRSSFIIGLLMVPFTLAFAIFFGMQMDWWGWGLGTVWILIVSGIAIPMLLLRKNKRLARLPLQCACGTPHNTYMGTLHGDHCYRCFSCGRLLKIRE